MVNKYTKYNQTLWSDYFSFASTFLSFLDFLFDEVAKNI